MRLKILSESGIWEVLACDSVITDRMTGTELLRYIMDYLLKYCPKESMGDEVRIRVVVEN